VIRRDVLARVEQRRLRPDVDVDAVRAEIELAVDGDQRLVPIGVSSSHCPNRRRWPTGSSVPSRISGALTELITRRDVEEITS